MQDLQGVVATNDETVKSLKMSITAHGKGAVVLGENEDTKPLAEQFVHIIGSHTASKDNLMKFNVDAKLFIGRLKEEKDPHTLEMIESILKIVSFK